MSTPSIALIPSGYKSGKLYSQLPVNGDGDLTFARVGNANRVNENGLIEEMATGVPRLDYSDGGCPSLLVEPSSTNLIEYSDDFSQASWIKTNTTISANAILSPDGSLNASKLVEDSSTGGHFISFNYSSSTDMSFSVFAKAGERTFIQLQASGVGLSDAIFDLSNGVVVSVESNATATILDYGNGWYRCSIKYTSSGTNNPVVRLYNGSDSYTGDGTSGIYLFGAQLEELSYATSYISTNGTTETRDAETVSKSGLSDYINSSEGVFYAEIEKTVDTFSSIRALSISDGTNNNSIVIGFNSDSNAYVVIRVGGSSIGNTSFLTTVGNSYKIAIKYKSGDTKIYINGLSIGTYTDIFTFSDTISEFSTSLGNGSLFPFYGKVKDLRVYKTTLSDTELQTLTS